MVCLLRCCFRGICSSLSVVAFGGEILLRNSKSTHTQLQPECRPVSLRWGACQTRLNTATSCVSQSPTSPTWLPAESHTMSENILGPCLQLKRCKQWRPIPATWCENGSSRRIFSVPTVSTLHLKAAGACVVEQKLPCPCLLRIAGDCSVRNTHTPASTSSPRRTTSTR